LNKCLRSIILSIIPKDKGRFEAEQELEEMKNLIRTVGGLTVLKIIQKRGRPSAKTYLGEGKIVEAQEIASELDADVIIVNSILKPNQIKHLTKIFNIEVWDRIDLILKIFNQHAKGELAKLEIQLAELKYAIPKLYGRGIEMSRLAGGIGTRGPGEQSLEYQKRHIRKRIKDIEKKIEKIKKVRDSQRKQRKRKNLPVVALVGYTNAGKTSLLQALTHKENLYIADKLFATLDTRIGNAYLPNLQKECLIVDTIGFIRDLPPFLINSFSATLEEVQNADLLLLVVDINDNDLDEKINVVLEILEDIGCDDNKKVLCFNKIDQLKDDSRIKILNRKYKKIKPVFISAYKKENLDDLINVISTEVEKYNLKDI